MSYDFESRLERAFRQRIYLMSAEKSPSNIVQFYSFIVMGASGKPYELSVSRCGTVYCSCPDHSQNRKLCKHLLFLLIRVLKQSEQYVKNNYYNYRGKGLNFECKSETFDCVAEFIDSNDCKRLLGKYDSVGHAAQRTIEKDDDCPICFENLLEGNEEIVYCKASCGKSLHKDCFMMWAGSGRSQIRCVYCRSDWVW